MDRTLKKIAVVLLIIILLPVTFFSVYEISTLNKNEEVLKGVYNKQLDAILYSVNQYSDDIVSSWRSSINLQFLENQNRNAYKAGIDSIVKLNSAIQYLFFADSLNSSEFDFTISKSNSIDTIELKNIYANAKDKIRRLFTYKRGGFYKIEPIETPINNNYQLLIFLTKDPEKEFNIAGVLINPEKFVKDYLSQKLQSVAEDQFIVTVNESNSNRQIYSTEQQKIENIQQQRALWLLPNYYLGIKFKGKTVEDLVNQRSSTNLILILVLSVLLIGAGIIVFINIKKEIELSQLKADFVSNVSHEIKTPLALISMFAETLEMGRATSEEKKKEYYLIISKEATRLSRIVNKILSFSKIEAGKREYRFSSVDINRLVEEVFYSYQFHLQNSGFKFSYSTGESIPEIQADGEAISEAVINLIDNSIKYSKDKKEITITTGSGLNSIFIEVKDKGIGISEENQIKIFEKFYRVSDGDGLVHNTKGTGLGLTLVKHIMDAHHGKIKVKSKLNEGSSFILSFPVNSKIKL